MNIIEGPEDIIFLLCLLLVVAVIIFAPNIKSQWEWRQMKKSLYHK